MAVRKDSKILVVDDSPAILALLKDMLVTQGYANVRTAGSVEEGLRMFEEEEPEVVFLDLMMPDSSGIEFTKKALAKNPKVQIVLSTALPSSHEAVVMAISQGASEYIQKPLRKDSVAQLMSDLSRAEESEAPKAPPTPPPDSFYH